MAQTKEVGVKLFVKGMEIPVRSDVSHKIDIDGNLVLVFKIGGANGTLDDVKLVFNKKFYLDVESEKIDNI